MFRVVSAEGMEAVTAPHSPMLRPTAKTFFDDDFEPLDLGHWTGGVATDAAARKPGMANHCHTLMGWLKSTRTATPPCSATLSSSSDNGCPTDDASCSLDDAW
eukprot:TRINITY_DN50397_c0_g1_i1.p3 TRINITY_DN50397_c0_g1~~TRINITY_DN50397_c0_g1_i1.p3  ORF type:complete len:103 (+),score=33.43 TRINITY_DN50397_c0_g1_i1:480-788(+)